MKEKEPQNTIDLEQFKEQILAREHLKEGVPHIIFKMIMVDNKYNHLDYHGYDCHKEENIENIKKNGTELGSYDRDDKNKGNIIDSYHMLSRIDDMDKYSRGYRNCIGAIFVGKSRINGKEMSFIVHIDSIYGDYENSKDNHFEEKEHKKHDELFSNAFDKNMEELLNGSESSTVDAVIFGGASWDTDRYKKAINRLSEEINKKLGFEPVILTGPGGIKDPNTDAYFNTQERKLYILRKKASNEDTDNPHYALSSSRREKINIKKRT